MLEVSNVKLPLDAGLNTEAAENLIKEAAAAALCVRTQKVKRTELLKRSVDARKKNNVHFVATLGVELAGGIAAEAALLQQTQMKNVRPYTPYEPLVLPNVNERCVDEADRPVVVGAGPAGLFCALYLARAGARPVLLERGAAVEERIAAVEAFNAGADLNPVTNIQFGEGGAGTFSDGKLTTSIKSPYAKHVLHGFVDAGAPEEILWQAKAHIGTDKLVDVVRTLREQIVAAGGEVRFNTQLTNLQLCEGKVSAVETLNTQTRAHEVLPTSRVVLACGHSARDTFEMLYDAGATMEQKPFSVGVRIEHLQEDINRAQYGEAAGHPALGAADYKLAVHLESNENTQTVEALAASLQAAYKDSEGLSGERRRHERFSKRTSVREKTLESQLCHQTDPQRRAVPIAGKQAEPRGVYTFCMCPGGEVVCAVSEPNTVVVNGMSRWARDGENANSALLVSVNPSDFGSSHPLAGVEFQRRIERAAYKTVLRAGGKPYQAPAQTVQSFLTGATSAPSKHVSPSYARGVVWTDLHECLPGFVTDALEQALPQLGRKLRGFDNPQAVMTGVETRSSSPVRIVRGEDLQSNVRGLYPCGEGPGYAGGIMSAACDGIRVALQVVSEFAQADSSK